MAATETAARTTRALDDLYRAHAREVYRYAYAALGNHADAEDVTQTTFVNALRALERGDRPRRPSSWLIAIAHNVVRQRYRALKARPAEVELDRDIAVEARSDDGPRLDELVRALQRIPHTQREALVMRELEGRSYGEIREVLELTPAALEMLLFRARRSLAEELDSVVTCERAELAIEQRHGGRLSRKQRRRLLDHLAACPACARLDASRKKRRRRLGALALFPLPFSLTFFRGTKSAAAAPGAPGGGAVVAAGPAVKALAVVAAVTAVGAGGYVGSEHVGGRGPASRPAVLQPQAGEQASRQPTAPAVQHGKPESESEPEPEPRASSRHASGPRATPSDAVATHVASADPGRPAARPARSSSTTETAPAAPSGAPAERAGRRLTPVAAPAAAIPEPDRATPATAGPAPTAPARAAVAAVAQPEQSASAPGAETELADAEPAPAGETPPSAPAPAPPAAAPPPTAAPSPPADSTTSPSTTSPGGATPGGATPTAPPDTATAGPAAPDAPQEGGRHAHGGQDGEHARGRDREAPGTPTRTRRGWTDRR